MAVIKRNWKPFSAVVLFMTILAFMVIQQGRHVEAVLQPEPPEYTVPSNVERSQVMKLLAELALDRDALVALNPDAQQAEDVLAAVRTWNDENAETLQGLADTVAQKRVALRDLRLLIRRGEAGENHEQQLATKIAELETALSSYRAGMNSLRSSVQQILSQSQQTTWTAIASGYGQHMPLRMLGLTGAQRLSITQARQRLEASRDASEDAQERATAIAQWESDLDSILTQDQKTVLAAFQSNFVSASGHVSSAFELVLPQEES